MVMAGVVPSRGNGVLLLRVSGIRGPEVSPHPATPCHEGWWKPRATGTKVFIAQLLPNRSGAAPPEGLGSASRTWPGPWKRQARAREGQSVASSKMLPRPPVSHTSSRNLPNLAFRSSPSPPVLCVGRAAGASPTVYSTRCKGTGTPDCHPGPVRRWGVLLGGQGPQLEDCSLLCWGERPCFRKCTRGRNETVTRGGLWWVP